MGVYIKGMDKPKSCKGCYFNGSNLSCFITRGRIDRDDYTCEIECPIIEVKTPHGRLVDIDKTMRIVASGVRLEVGELSELTTVIEAEVE